jgi:hypothetical protein
MKKGQAKQERKSRSSTQQQGLRGLGGRIKARNRPEDRKIENYKKSNT